MSDEGVHNPYDDTELLADIATLIERQEDMLGSASLEEAITATLRVSPNGSGADGLSWRTAYQTIQDALDAASTDTDDCTLIFISPHTTNYDIDTTGDPTWAANVILKGTHRCWAKVINSHATATSILKLTGKSAVIGLYFDLGSGSCNGLIMTSSGFRIHDSLFLGEDLTDAATAIYIDGTTAQFGQIFNTFVKGHTTHMTGILLDNAACTLIDNVRVGFCTTGVQIIHADSDLNKLATMDICSCGIGLDIDAGNNQQLEHIHFIGNTVNVDDEVGDHALSHIHGEFEITTVPDNLAGVTITAGVGANTWSAADTQVRAAGDKPFRIVGVTLDPDANEKYRIRLTDGSRYFDDIWAEGGVGVAAKGTQAPSGTEFIFNRGVAISASAKSESGGNDIDVSLQIQEI